jgi:type III pantothenate kinase
LLFAIDIGNTNTVLGIYQEERLVAHFRIATDRNRTADEYGILATQLMSQHGLLPSRVSGVIIACVVPPLLATFVAMARTYFHCEPLVLTGQSYTGLKVRYNPPQAVGADRIANAVAAQRKYRVPAIIVDLGTATTFDVVSAVGEYLGGAIMPGVVLSLEALSFRAAQLPRIELRSPGRAIGVDTVTSMQSGVVYGTAGAIDAMVRRIKAELAGNPIVIATGGLARAVADESQEIEVVDEQLTLDGLFYVYQQCRTASAGGEP